MNKVGGWLIPAVVGSVFGAVLGKVYLELYLTSSGWWGAGNNSIGLLFRGPLQAFRLFGGGWADPVREGVVLYCLQAMMFFQAASSQRRRRVLGVAAYVLWNVGTLVALAWLSLRLGAALFFQHESDGWRMFAKISPSWFAAFGALLLVWHVAIWMMLIRGGMFVGTIRFRGESNCVEKAKNVPGR